MIDYSVLYEKICETPLSPWVKILLSQMDKIIVKSTDANIIRWGAVLKELPKIHPSLVDFQSSSITIGKAEDCDKETREKTEHQLRQLLPWRKGPYDLFGIHIDTEWRSDRKWNRLCNEIQSLEGRMVLDVGCGNGYHCWRMAGAGARLVIGIDPYILYTMQFQAIRHFIADARVYLLPVGIEMVPNNLNCFDSVFSMGVLYHRRSPVDHLLTLRSTLRSGGELILETLVIDGSPGQIVIPEGRYAKMNNVWFIPSCSTLEILLKRCGYSNVRLINVCRTTPREQRATEWMTFESLSDFLDKKDPTLTIEGLPAPTRAIFLATNP